MVWKDGWGKKVILAAPLPHVEVQLSAQPLLTSNDGLFEWSAELPRDHRMKKGKMNTGCSCKSVLTCVSRSLFFQSPG